ncbi:MAG TPA: hypothetical protein VHW74_05540 [Mycobacteriales bacterium]|jgi:hypothetical protein|nr:hypothetical protein [Mycobacteriales bacterium]
MQERPVAPINWRAEIVTAVVLAIFVALLGSAVGLIWHAVAPHIDVNAALDNPEEKTKALMGDDLWLGLLGLIGGVVCVALVAVAAPDSLDGPGALVGLVVGGFLAMYVADRVGYLVSGSSLRMTLSAAFPDATPKGLDSVVGLLDFKVRAMAVMISWPLASLLVSSTITWLRAIKQPTVRPVPAYPGSP